ncbi:Rieske 2Fe-2S domain-containing protein [Thalassotalea sediminis]|uniref:Rieske 2Fe-2S domain-containing protein n=1 Tax=Thalassotalea sediminis TaxID=1759089 RepID=UPI002573713C|nr:Rieske 2Fe-2S domain-containing protein [Thalassotalea sediminis]
MNKDALIQYFPAGGVVDHDIEIFDAVKLSSNTNSVWRANAALPPAHVEKAILIFELEDGEHREYRAIPAKCPHQGADLSNDTLKKDGNVYCHLHKRPICVFSEYNYAFNVEKRGDNFVITP